MWIIAGAVAALAILLVVLLARAAAFKPVASQPVLPAPVEVDTERATANLSQMVQCQTVSSDDPSLTDESEFVRFRELLAQLYPAVHAACPPERIGPTGLLYRIKGRTQAEPVVLMAHYDVVPADKDAWQKPPFSGLVEDGYIWGRGTLDTKITLCAAMEAVESLLAADPGWQPQNDIYLAFSGDEEIAGPTAPAMVEELERCGVRPALVLDEGGAVVEGIFPGVSQPCALVGIAEKGMVDVELVMQSPGGHASAPPPQTLIGQLSQAAVRIEAKPFSTRLTGTVAQMLDTLGRHSSFTYRLIFANLWCFMPLLDLICRRQGGELNAMLRTTCALTTMQGSQAVNVLPSTAKMGANLRLIGGDTPEDAVERLRQLSNNSDIKFNILYGMAPSPESRTDTPHWQRLTTAISQTWPDALVAPYLMVAASDSRHYCRISDGVYRFSAMALGREARDAIHGHDERVPIESLAKAVAFYLRLLRQC